MTPAQDPKTGKNTKNQKKTKNTKMKNHQKHIKSAILAKSDIGFGISVFFYIGKIGSGMIFDIFLKFSNFFDVNRVFEKGLGHLSSIC